MDEGDYACSNCGVYFEHQFQFFCGACDEPRKGIPSVNSFEPQEFYTLMEGWALKDEKTACCNRYPDNCQCDVTVTLELAQQVLKDEIYDLSSNCDRCVHYMRFSCWRYKEVADDIMVGHDIVAIKTCPSFIWADSANSLYTIDDD